MCQGLTANRRPVPSADSLLVLLGAAKHDGGKEAPRGKWGERGRWGVWVAGQLYVRACQGWNGRSSWTGCLPPGELSDFATRLQPEGGLIRTRIQPSRPRSSQRELTSAEIRPCNLASVCWPQEQRHALVSLTLPVPASYLHSANVCNQYLLGADSARQGSRSWGYVFNKTNKKRKGKKKTPTNPQMGKRSNLERRPLGYWI